MGVGTGMCVCVGGGGVYFIITKFEYYLIDWEVEECRGNLVLESGQSRDNPLLFSQLNH